MRPQGAPEPASPELWAPPPRRLPGPVPWYSSGLICPMSLAFSSPPGRGKGKAGGRSSLPGSGCGVRVCWVRGRGRAGYLCGVGKAKAGSVTMNFDCILRPVDSSLLLPQAPQPSPPLLIQTSSEALVLFGPQFPICVGVGGVIAFSGLAPGQTRRLTPSLKWVTRSNFSVDPWGPSQPSRALTCPSPNLPDPS